MDINRQRTNHLQALRRFVASDAVDPGEVVDSDNLFDELAELLIAVQVERQGISNGIEDLKLPGLSADTRSKLRVVFDKLYANDSKNPQVGGLDHSAAALDIIVFRAHQLQEDLPSDEAEDLRWDYDFAVDNAEDAIGELLGNWELLERACTK